VDAIRVTTSGAPTPVSLQQTQGSLEAAVRSLKPVHFVFTIFTKLPSFTLPEKTVGYSSREGAYLKERWQQLAELITQEKDSEKLLLLTQELNEALADKDSRQKVVEPRPAA
jgi:cobyrinic acid a,c-diamide synthase